MSFATVQNIFSILIILQIFYPANGFSLNPWAAPSPTSTFNFPTFRNPILRAPYQTCSKDTYGVMKTVEVIPCDGEKRCPLVKGTNVSLNLEFIPSFPARSVIGSLSGVLNSYLPTIRFGKPEDLCASNQVECPLEPGKLYHYRTTVFVKQQFPKLRLDTKIVVQGDKQDIACALIPVEIVDPPAFSAST